MGRALLRSAGQERSGQHLWNIMWMRFHNMATIQVVLDAELLKAADKIVRRTKQNRSALIRHALREYLKKLDIQEKVQRERNGYLALPQSQNEVAMWESEQVWPE